LCRDRPVSALCLYDRGGAAHSHLDMAVACHPDEVRDAQARLRSSGNTVRLGREFDLVNIDVLDTALYTVTAGRARWARSRRA
jgi:hypothetical protein